MHGSRRFAVSFALVAWLIGAFGTAAAADPEFPVEVIPGGPAFVLAGPYVGSGELTVAPGAVPCATTSLQLDTTGDFTHPSLGPGVYEFHVVVCRQGTRGERVKVSGAGSFVLAGATRTLGGTLVLPTTTTTSEGNLQNTYQLHATGACIAHFRADGLVETPGVPPLVEEAGTLTQQGAIVCRVGA